AWPFIDQMNPSKDVLALSSIEVDLSGIVAGQSITVNWRGKPVFIRHRTQAEIAAAKAVSLDDLPDPQADTERAEKPEWLILVGVCTHLGCVPLGQQGEYNGWFCPCHGSHYDTSGRIRKGPAPVNMTVPDYVFLDDSNIKIG
ncbi:MAG: ubiquinol-cytochrome c reductase iron-sulfur subunit, partial [Alphaproteobacteria bacterium]